MVLMKNTELISTTCSADMSTERPVPTGTPTEPTSLSTHKSHSTSKPTVFPPTTTHPTVRSITHSATIPTWRPTTHSASTTHTITTPTMTSHRTSLIPYPTLFPITPKYELCNEMYCCVILQGNFSFTIPYEMENNKTSTLMIGVPANAMVTGTCNLNNTNTAQEIDVDFFDGWKLSVVIGESMANGDELQARVDEVAAQFYSWERVTLEYVLDDHFVKPKGKGENMTVMTVLTFDRFKTDTLGSFACDSKESLKLGEVDFLISNLQYRGFSHTNSTDFPKADVKRCPQDFPKTTAKPDTTSAKPATTTAKPGNNKICAYIYVGAFVVTLLALVLVIGGITFYRIKKHQRETLNNQFESAFPQFY